MVNLYYLEVDHMIIVFSVDDNGEIIRIIDDDEHFYYNITIK